jgi:serine/threonine-protein kinase HipA
MEKQADFIEYAEARGAVVAGATDVAGDAPKFLLVRDRKRRWHPDWALKDWDILDSWLASHSEEVGKLPDIMRKCKAEEEVIEGVAGRCAEIAADLREAGRGYVCREN